MAYNKSYNYFPSCRPPGVSGFENYRLKLTFLTFMHSTIQSHEENPAVCKTVVISLLAMLEPANETPLF
jgi:hypothetical protein